LRSCVEDHAPGHCVRRLALWVVAGAVALGFWWREHPSPCPYGLRLWLVLPRPVITWRRLIDILSPREGERILEIGAGTGYYALRGAERVGKSGRLDVLDIQKSMLDHLAARARERGLGTELAAARDQGGIQLRASRRRAARLLRSISSSDRRRTRARARAHPARAGGARSLAANGTRTSARSTPSPARHCRPRSAPRTGAREALPRSLAAAELYARRPLRGLRTTGGPAC
jgi:hypothetical protein